MGVDGAGRLIDGDHHFIFAACRIAPRELQHGVLHDVERVIRIPDRDLGDLEGPLFDTRQESFELARRVRLPQWAPILPPYAIGSIAMFWVIERAAALW